MLDTLRKGAQGWVAKLLLVLLVAAFGVWGVSGSMFNTASSSVVTVGETTVSPNEYRLAYNRQMAVLGQQLNTQLTSDQARAFGVPERTFSAVIAGATLDEQARQMNLGLSDERLASLVGSDPTFQDFNGRFDRGNFTRVLRSVGMSEADYIESRSRVAVRSQIVEAIADGIKAPDALLTAIAQHEAESRDVEYVLLPSSVVGEIAQPDDAAVSEFFEKNKANYKAPEYRKIVYVKLEPEDISDPSAVADDMVKAEYEATKAKFSTPETRTVDQLVFADQAAAEAAVEQIANGGSFDTFAEDMGRSATDIRIGTFAKDKAPSAAIGEAVFEVSTVGGVTGVVAGPFGPVVLRVAEISPASEKPFAEVETELRKDLALAEAYDQIFNVHDGLEDSLAGGMTLQEAAKLQKLDLVTIEAVDRTGRDTSGEVLKDIPQSRDLLQGAFETDIGVEVPPLNIGSNGFVWYQVADITEERDRPLDEVREKVVADLVADKTANELGKKATELADRLKNGEALDTIAGELGVTVERKYSLKRDSQDPVFAEAAVNASFGGPVDHSGVTIDGTGENRILFKVASVDNATGVNGQSIAEEQRTAASSGVGDDILDQMVATLRTSFGVAINRPLAEQAIAY